jgi:hypothetical protein
VAASTWAVQSTPWMVAMRTRLEGMLFISCPFKDMCGTLNPSSALCVRGVRAYHTLAQRMPIMS